VHAPDHLLLVSVDTYMQELRSRPCAERLTHAFSILELVVEDPEFLEDYDADVILTTELLLDQLRACVRG
jgi:hypothetical protein